MSNLVYTYKTMGQEKSLTKRIIKGSLTVVVLTGLATPVSYLIKMLYSRTLSIEMFGLFFAILAFFMSLASLSDLGFGYSVSYLVPKYFKKKKYQQCWNLYFYNLLINVSVSVVLSLVIFTTASFLSKYYFKLPEAKNVVYIFIIYLIANGLTSSLDKIFLGLQQERYYAAIQTVRNVASLILSVLIWFVKSANIVYYAAAWSFGTIIAFFIFIAIMMKKNQKIVKRVTWDLELFRSMTKLAFPSFVTTLLYLLTNSVAIIFLTLLKGVADVGVFSIVAAIATISNIVLTPINIFFLPLISHLMEDEKEKIQKIFYTGMQIVPFVGFYFALFIILFPAQTISILFGSKWVDLAKNPLIIFSIIYIGTQTASFLGTIIQGIGEVKKQMKASIVIAIINVVGSYILINKYSVTGAVLAGGATFLASIILYTNIIKKTFQTKFPFILYAKLAIISILMVAIVKFLNIQPLGIIQYLIIGFIYTIILTGAAYKLKLFNINMIKSFLRT